MRPRFKSSRKVHDEISVFRGTASRGIKVMRGHERWRAGWKERDASSMSIRQMWGEGTKVI